MNTIAGVFTPALLAVFCGLSLGFGTVLFVISRRGDIGAIDLNTPLSWAEPVELRLVLYLIIGAMSGTGALVLRLLFGFFAAGAFVSWTLLILAIVGFAGNLAFFYAAGGSLVQAAQGTRGRPPFWYFSLLSPVDGLVMDIGDVLARFFFRPAPAWRTHVRRRRYEYEDELGLDSGAPVRGIRRERRRYDYGDDLDYGREMPARDGPTVRRGYDCEDELQPTRDSQRDEPTVRGAARRRGGRLRSDEDYLEIDADQHESSLDTGASVRRTRRAQGARTRDLPRERLELALEQYEEALSPPQMEKLREMRSLVESIRQCG